MVVAGRHEYGAEESQRLRRQAARISSFPLLRFPTGMQVAAGGAPPQGVDFLERAYGAFPWLVLCILVLTYVDPRAGIPVARAAAEGGAAEPADDGGRLRAAGRSPAGGARSAEALGVGHGGQIEGWIPIFLFAVLFGLSMDYEVFVVTRMREVWDETGDNELAVATGLERTGRIVTAAALIMAAAFCGFMVGSVTGLRQLGLALALGVLLDATLVRSVLVPALMTVLREYNWWLPASRRTCPAGRALNAAHEGDVREGRSAPLPQPGTTLSWRW